MAIAFRISSSIYHNPKTGVVEIDITPDDPKIDLTGQQILDAVAELLLWHWKDAHLEVKKTNGLDS